MLRDWGVRDQVLKKELNTAPHLAVPKRRCTGGVWKEIRATVQCSPTQQKKDMKRKDGGTGCSKTSAKREKQKGM